MEIEEFLLEILTVCWESARSKLIFVAESIRKECGDNLSHPKIDRLNAI